MNRNYQKELDQILEALTSKEQEAQRGTDRAERSEPPRLLLHSCCAPCSSYVLEYLRQYFRITVFYYNPNITEDAEYHKRVAEQKRLIEAYNERLTDEVNKNRGREGLTDAGTSQVSVWRMCGENAADVSDGKAPGGYSIRVVEGDYVPAHFYEIAKGLEQCPEGGERCFACYALRLRETARRAQAGGFDYFTTTLSISPLKNAAKLNEIGERLAGEYGVPWLPSDFKKKGGYQRSIELSKEYELYRQNYCGCVYSREQ